MTTSEPVRPNMVIHERYSVVRPIGQGGFGAVYEAIDQRLGATVALKQTMHRDARRDSAFEREARLLASLRHPALPRVSDYFTDVRGLFLVMEFIPGDDLLALLHRRNAPFGLDEVLTWADQLLAALDFLHTQTPPIIHHDIKPQNLKLTPRGEVILLDFGLARGRGPQPVSEPGYDRLTASASSNTTIAPITPPATKHATVRLHEGGGTSLHAFTPAYAPPEQIAGKATDARSDLYALAATLYALLTGAPPASAQTRTEALQQAAIDPLEPLDQRNPQVSAAISTVVMQTLALDAGARLPSAAAMRTALRRARQSPNDTGWSQTATVEGGEEDHAHRAPAPEPFRPSGADGVSDSQTPRNRSRMLEKVRRFWVEGVLQQSLHQAALIDLQMTTQPDAVAYPWEMLIERPDATPSLLPAGTPIGQVFDDLGSELLILGEPGSGKTTLLLELARDLLDRADQVAQHPIPVVFNLASWAVQRQPLAVWLVEELASRYQVPSRIGQAWVEQDQLVPLLDGLDEVEQVHRAACVEAINRFAQERSLPGLVVCSRHQDYAALGLRLLLQGAVMLQPLTSAQIDAYLARPGEALDGVRTLLQDDPVLQELAATPLMLGIITLAYQGEASRDLAQLGTLEERRRHIFATYVQRMFARRGGTQPYTPAQVEHWLAWLAGRMVERQQTLFSIEGLQPDWLATTWQRRAYIALAGVSGGLASGLIGGVVSVVLILGILLLLNVRSAGEVTSTEFLPGLLGSMLEGFLAGWGMGLVTGALAGWLVSAWQLRHPPLDNRKWAIILSGFLASLLCTGGIWGISQLIFGIRTGLAISVISGPQLGLVVAMLMRTWHIQPVEHLRWSWMGARRALVVGVGIGLISVLPISLVFNHLVYGLFLGIVFGLGFLLFFMLFAGLGSGDVPIKIQPNEGIRRSLVNALITWLGGALIGGVGIGCFVGGIGGIGLGLVQSILPGLGQSLSNGVMVGIQLGLIFGMFFGPLFGPLFGLSFGGLAVVQHYTLRCILALNRYLPLDLVRFLDHTTERILLRRVGGGYIFIHRMLLEYFASLEPEQQRGKATS